MQRIGRTIVRRFLVESRFARLYLCWDPALERRVVAKIFAVEPDVPQPPLSWEEWRERFLAEGRVMARLDHVNILPMLYAGTLSTGRPYHLLPFHPTNLPSLIGFDVDDPKEVAHYGERARPRALPVAEALPILAQVARGLAYLHGQGLVHRDIKPANVLLTGRNRPTVRLCDFGLVKVGAEPDMAAGAWVGSDDYISPEQRQNAGRVTDRTDVYSLGRMAWRMLMGRLPAEGGEPLVVKGLRRNVAQAIERALASDPGDRPAAVELACAFGAR